MADSVKTLLDAEEAITGLLATLEQLRVKTMRHADAEAAQLAAAADLAKATAGLRDAAAALEGCAIGSQEVLKVIRDAGSHGLASRLDKLTSMLGGSGALAGEIREILAQSAKDQLASETRITEVMNGLSEDIQGVADLPDAVGEALHNSLEELQKQQAHATKQSVEAVNKRLEEIVTQLKTVSRFALLAFCGAAGAALTSLWIASIVGK